MSQVINCYKRTRRRRRMRRRRKYPLLLVWTVFLLSFPIKYGLSGAIRQRNSSNNSNNNKQEEGEELKEEEEYNNNKNNSIDDDNQQQQQSLFLDWVEDALNINTEFVTIENFEYFDYNSAMRDRVDIFYDEENWYYCHYYNTCNNNNNNEYTLFHSDNEKDDEDQIEERRGIVNDEQGQKQQQEEVYDNYDDDDNDDDDEDQFLSVQDYPRVTTRGLAAAKDITSGQIILKIPHAALWTVSNKIDGHPILSKIMGESVRKNKYGWNTEIDEIPILAVALLYYINQEEEEEGKKKKVPSSTKVEIDNIEKAKETKEEGEEDNNGDDYYTAVSYGPYLRLLQQQGINIKEQIPHFWDSKTLRKSATIGVRKVAKGIQRDVRELYERILIPLITDYPNIFGNNNNDDDLEWMYSLEKFHWAFAVVNSRHWHLPIPDETKEKDGDSNNNNNNGDSSPSPASSINNNNNNVQLFDDNNASPPASMPTDEWMDFQQEVEHRRDEVTTKSKTSTTTAEGWGGGGRSGEEEDDWSIGNSFLAPVADLLNFGPPCTRGVYNTTTHTFDILATCDIAKGQELTFWYADACQDVFMANYGFTFEFLVPSCQSQDNHNDFMTNKAIELEEELLSTLDEIDQMDLELDNLWNVLKQCECEISDKVSPSDKSQNNNNGNDNNNNDHGKPKETGITNKNSIMVAAATSPVPPKLQSQSRSRQDPQKDSRHARHAIRGARNNSNKKKKGQAPSSGSSNKHSDRLTLSQKRRQRRQDEASSSRDL